MLAISDSDKMMKKDDVITDTVMRVGKNVGVGGQGKFFGKAWIRYHGRRTKTNKKAKLLVKEFRIFTLLCILCLEVCIF